MIDASDDLAEEIIGEYKRGRPLVWFIECDGVLVPSGVETASDVSLSEMLKPLRSLSELASVLVAVGGTAAVTELRHFVPLQKLVFAGYSGSDLVIDERQLGHSGVPLARRMIENIGRWIESDLSAIPNARVTIHPLCVHIDTKWSDHAETNQIRTIVTRVVDKFRATVRLKESDRSLDVVWVLASNSDDVIEALLKRYPDDSPLICCVAHHSWMNAALLATQSRDGKTIGVGVEPGVTVGHCLADPQAFVHFLTGVSQRLSKVCPISVQP